MFLRELEIFGLVLFPRYVCSSMVCDPSDLDAWQKFLLLPRCILANPKRGGRIHWRETQRKNKHAGEYTELCTKKGSFETQRKTNSRRAKRAVEDGHYKKAIQALCLSSVSPAGKF